MERQFEFILLDKQLLKDVEAVIRRIYWTKDLSIEERKKEAVARSLRVVQTFQELSIKVVAEHVDEEAKQLLHFCQEDSVELKSRLRNLSFSLLILAALMELEIGRGSGIVIKKLASMLFELVDKMQENSGVSDEIVNTIQGIRLILMLQKMYPDVRRLSYKSTSKTEPLENFTEKQHNDKSGMTGQLTN